MQRLTSRRSSLRRRVGGHFAGGWDGDARSAAILRARLPLRPAIGVHLIWLGAAGDRPLPAAAGRWAWCGATKLKQEQKGDWSRRVVMVHVALADARASGCDGTV
jgi:hypothetical protein